MALTAFFTRTRWAINGHWRTLNKRGDLCVITRTGVVIGDRGPVRPQPQPAVERFVPREPIDREWPGFWWSCIAAGAAAAMLSRYFPGPWF